MWSIGDRDRHLFRLVGLRIKVYNVYLFMFFVFLVSGFVSHGRCDDNGPDLVSSCLDGVYAFLCMNLDSLWVLKRIRPGRLFCSISDGVLIYGLVPSSALLKHSVA
ncbi:hypothetical protein F4779DRAFT_579485 [Xylariaceae sp. FL0662B]|nr:hypothetical protein F4779DRAFT_579485 [Xylariaceae sp. FL0662B]